MTTSLEPGPLGIIARIAMPTLLVGTLRHARKTSRACSHRSSVVIKHVIVLDHSMARSIHHPRFAYASAATRAE